MTKNPMRYELDTMDEYGFALYERFVPADTTYPLHWHDFLEFEIIISGTLKHLYNGKQYTLNKGDAYMMCRYDFHSLTAVTDVRLYSLHFTKSLLEPEITQFLDFHQFHCSFNEKEAENILQGIHKLSKETCQNLPFQNLIIKNTISEIIIFMIRKSTTNKIYTTPQPIQQAIAYTNEHFLEKITLEELAEHLSFSTNYLGQLFKTQIGCTFHEYLNTLRLKYACSLLRSSHMPVKEIASISGYNSVEYFMYVFRKKIGMTPNAYRKQAPVQ